MKREFGLIKYCITPFYVVLLKIRWLLPNVTRYETVKGGMDELKKLCAFLLAAALAASVCGSNAYAAATPSVSLSSGKAQAGGSVTLTASIQDNPGVSSVVLYFYYDTSVFTVDPKKGISADGAFRSTGGVMGNTIALAKQNGRFSGDQDQDGVLALWYNSKGIDTSDDGNFLKAEFQVSPSASNGNHTIALGFGPEDTLNQEGKRVALQTGTAVITVSGGVDAPPNPPASGGSGETTNPPASDGSGGTTNPPASGGSGGTTNPPVSDGSGETTNPPASDGTGETTVPPNQSGTQQPPNSSDSSQKPDNSGGSKPGNGASGGSTSGGSNGGAGNSGGTDKPVTTEIRFNDVANHWAETYIQQAAQKGLVEGYNGSYRPNDTMRRSELVTILWRAKGSPKPSKAASFTDLTQDWYIEAVSWAEENGVFNGVGHGLFDPNGIVTREQLAAVLHRLSGAAVGMEEAFFDSYDQAFSDSEKVSGWARKSLYWTVYHDIFCGENSVSTGRSLAPGAAADRAQIAVMMVRYLQKYS